MNNDNGGLLDLHAITAIINRRLTAIIASAAIVIALTVVAYMLAPRIYTATARVALERNSADVMQVGVDKADITIDSSSVETEVQVLQSPAIAEAAVKKLGLDKSVDFLEELKNPKTDYRRAIDKVRGGLTVKRDGTSYAIAVSFDAKDPALATDIVNAVTSSYVNRQRQDKTDVKSDEIALLSERLGKLRQDLLDAETAVARYRARTNLIDITKDKTNTQQELTILNTQLASAKAELAAAQARAAASRSGTTTNLLENPVVNQLTARKAQLLQQRNDLAGRYGERHPALTSVDRQLAEVNTSIDAETARVRSSVSSEAQIASQRVGSIQTSINRANGDLRAGNDASVELGELERNAESARQLYQAFLDRYRGALATQGTETSNSYIVSQALTPHAPSSPSLPAFVLGGLMSAVIVAGLVTFLLEMLERGFRSRAEMESALGIPVAGSIPDMRTVKNEDVGQLQAPLHMADYLVGHPDSIFTESFRSLRTALRLGNKEHGPRSLVVTSSIAEEGKTTTAICIARSAALAGHKVVLVDCDMRRRASSRNLSDKLKAGLIEVLNGTGTLEQALVRDSASGAMLLPQREVQGTEYDIIASEAMKRLIKELSTKFDLVILDSAPVLPVAETRAIAAMAEATLLVVRWRKTPQAAVEMTLRELERSQANVVGTVLSKVNVSRKGGVGYEIYYYTPYAPAH